MIVLKLGWACYDTFYIGTWYLRWGWILANTSIKVLIIVVYPRNSLQEYEVKGCVQKIHTHTLMYLPAVDRGNHVRKEKGHD
jgi:hypothetical protein